MRRVQRSAPILCGAALALVALSILFTFPEPIMSAHMTPEQVRSKIDHPIVDGDGHWVEYDPVFSDKMRKAGGDIAADGFLKAMGTTCELLSMPVAERRAPFACRALTTALAWEASIFVPSSWS